MTLLCIIGFMNIFENWNAIKSKIEKVKESRPDCSKRSFQYLWDCIQNYIYNSYEDDNLKAWNAQLYSRSTGKSTGNEVPPSANPHKVQDDWSWAAAAKGKGKKGKKGKGKGKGKKGDKGKGKGKEKGKKGKDSGADTRAAAAKGTDKGKGKGKGKFVNKNPNNDPTIDNRSGEPKKNVLCFWHAQGNCPKGRDCEYSHNEQELAQLRAKAKAAPAKAKSKAEPKAKGEAKPKARPQGKQKHTFTKAGKAAAYAAILSQIQPTHEARADGQSAGRAASDTGEASFQESILRKLGILSKNTFQSCKHTANVCLRTFAATAALSSACGPILCGSLGDTSLSAGAPGASANISPPLIAECSASSIGL